VHPASQTLAAAARYSVDAQRLFANVIRRSPRLSHAAGRHKRAKLSHRCRFDGMNDGGRLATLRCSAAASPLRSKCRRNPAKR